jgi:hypothetical protein
VDVREADKAALIALFRSQITIRGEEKGRIAAFLMFA